MKKIIKLNESDVERLVKKIIREEGEDENSFNIKDVDNWMNSFIAKRDHEDAQWEIKLLAREISRKIKHLWPIAHENYVKHGKIPPVL